MYPAVNRFRRSTALASPRLWLLTIEDSTMLSFHRERDVPLLETDRPWAFRPGDIFRGNRDAFEITREAAFRDLRCSPGQSTDSAES